MSFPPFAQNTYVFPSTFGIERNVVKTSQLGAHNGIDVKVLAIYRRLDLSTSVCSMFFK